MPRKRKDDRVLKALKKYWPEAERVIDARRNLIVNVGSTDVAGAQPKDAANCVMARACKREQEVDAVLVFPTRAYILQGTLVTRFMVPESMTREVAILDRGGTPLPGRFHFQAPSPKERMGQERPGDRHLDESVASPRKKPIHLRTEGLRKALF